MVADIEELEEMDASELHVRRLNAPISAGDLSRLHQFGTKVLPGKPKTKKEEMKKMKMKKKKS